MGVPIPSVFIVWYLRPLSIIDLNGGLLAPLIASNYDACPNREKDNGCQGCVSHWLHATQSDVRVQSVVLGLVTWSPLLNGSEEFVEYFVELFVIWMWLIRFNQLEIENYGQPISFTRQLNIDLFLRFDKRNVLNLFLKYSFPLTFLKGPVVRSLC